MKVGVIGAGTMGAGICEVFAKAGWDVAMTASSAASAQKHTSWPLAMQRKSLRAR